MFVLLGIILGSVIWALDKIGLLASLSTKFDLLCHEGDWHVVLESHGVFVLHVSVQTAHSAHNLAADLTYRLSRVVLITNQALYER